LLKPFFFFCTDWKFIFVVDLFGSTMDSGIIQHAKSIVLSERAGRCIYVELC